MKEYKLDFDNLEIAFSSKSDKDLKRANRIFTLINNPRLSNFGAFFVKLSLRMGLPVTGIIRKTVFNHFCGGISIHDCNSTIKELSDFGIGTILDYSVEGEENEESFDNTEKELLKVISAAASDDAIPFSVFKMSGMASSSILKKQGSGTALSEDEAIRWKRIRERTNEVCKAAYDADIPIMIDAEETWIQDAIDHLTLDMMRIYNREKVVVYNTYQMYRADSLERLKRDHQLLKKEGFFMGAKLVRGAYMEKERERASEKGYPSPIHANKKSTDKCFDDGLRYCAENYKDLSVVCGSHNEHSNHLLADIIVEKGIPTNSKSFWFAQLYGMSDNISFNLAKAGFNVTKYVPYGPVKSVMPYLFRRAEENTSVEGQSSRELKMIRKELKRRSRSN